MKKSELKNLIKEEINKTLVSQISKDYMNLLKAHNDPNYPSTPHTNAAISKLEDKIKQMSQKEEYKQEFMKLIPKNLEKLLSK